MNPPGKNLPNDTEPPFRSSRLHRLRGWAHRLAAFDARALWWRLLDLFEEKRWFRHTAYAAALAVALGVAGWIWVYPQWHERNAIGIARGWLAAGKLDQASEAVRTALQVAPLRPESWQLAAEIAQRLGNKPAALTYARHAARLRPGDLKLNLEWASRALLADNLDEAATALQGLPSSAIDHSAPALRIAGELARRQLRLGDARDRFEAALRLDGPRAIDEVPLGIVLIDSRDPAERNRGLDLLARRASDPQWGPAALRPLLEDAIAHDDRQAMLRWGEALRTHPLCTAGDMPRCLLAISRADPARFATLLDRLENDYAGNPARIVALIGWLNQIGRSDDAVRWIHGLPVALTRRPPVIVAAAEALRLSADWSALATWTDGPAWSDDVEFLRLCYHMQAGLKTGRKDDALTDWAAVQSLVRLNGAHALFAGDALITWGLPDQAEALWWIAAKQPGVATRALGTLARHYQVRHDAEGQYRAFGRLHSLRPDDTDIANNLAFFAALTGQNYGLADRLARKNFRRNPGNLVFRSTYAFVLCQEGQKDEALALLKPYAPQAAKSPALAFAYGLVLAGTGHLAEAHALLDPLDRTDMTTDETDLLADALDD